LIHKEEYDVIVAGGGHAGVEATLAAARMGKSVLMVTMSREAIGRMSCNPAIGGSAKGHLVREIDALGGEMGLLADRTGIQFRVLNRSKGPAVWSPRCQNDRELYAREASSSVLGQDGVDVLEDIVVDIATETPGSEKAILTGVITQKGQHIRCKAFVLSAGTFMRAIMHTGLQHVEGGRFGEKPSLGLTQELEKLGFVSGRLKTGTPPRVSLKSLDLAKMEEQHSDNPPQAFSFRTEKIENKLIPMYLTHTNEKTHEILRGGFDRSPMFTGRIMAVGPRYCPSIEDKINRFSDKNSHQIFLEPEGYETDVVYMNGFSSSLPEDIQLAGMRTITGMEKVEMVRPGYAVEYDFFPPHQIHLTMETKLVQGLFFAGQINGTSGYEEAAAQGLLAGINAALRADGRGESFTLKRSEAYIGVLIDDLVNKSTEEPYRMFTSRAEYRLLLRHDNADLRLMEKGRGLGLIPDEAYQRLIKKKNGMEAVKNALTKISLTPEDVNASLVQNGGSPLNEPERVWKIIKRPEADLFELMESPKIKKNETIQSLIQEHEDRLVTDIIQQVETEMKYEGYIKRQKQQIKKFDTYESNKIPPGINYAKIKALSAEGIEKLKKVKPESIGQASRISGVTPSDISVLMVYIKG
jgi:tRNA uridine 5-carboxymethylaminomethyl modification enzyme